VIYLTRVGSDTPKASQLAAPQHSGN